MLHSAMHVEYPPAKKARLGINVAVNPGVPGAIGEVRFDNPAAAHAALALNGSNLCGAIITVEINAHSKDGTKLKVSGIPKGADWQELKDHFAPFGRVVFADVKGGKKQMPVTGVVRYLSADSAELALSMMNGAELHGRRIEAKLHGGSKDATKVMVFGLPPSFEWQELKDFASQAGPVEFADVIVSDGSMTVGEIRYDIPSHAALAVATLHGSTLGGAQLDVIADPNSSDGSKVIVRNIPPGIQWQDLKDHFVTIGSVAHSSVVPMGVGPKGAFGKCGGKRSNQMWWPEMWMEMPVTGVVRYQSAEIAQAALSMMNGAEIQGWQIEAKVHPGSKDATKLMVFGLPPFCRWQDLKDMAAQAGPVLHADVISADSSATVGEIRYADASHAGLAVATLHGSILGGTQIAVMPAPNSFDGSKVMVQNISPGIEWQELKDHFSTIGSVAHSSVKPMGAGPKGAFGACDGMGMMAPSGKKGVPGKGVGKNSMQTMNQTMMNMGMMNMGMMNMGVMNMGMMNPQMMPMMGGDMMGYQRTRAMSYKSG